MLLFITSESSEDVSIDIGIRDKEIENFINKRLEDANLSTDFHRWTFIYYCVSPEFSDFFQETLIARRNPKTIEHRLGINYESFKKSSNFNKLQMIFDAIERSVSLMKRGDFKVDDLDRDTLLKIISDARRAIK
jgi:hypothetical protein